MNSLTVEQVQDGLEKIWTNAKELTGDARVLFAANRSTRAYTLAHLAREELSKIPMLFHVGVDLMCGNEVDWKELWKRFTSHKKKLRVEAVQNASIVPWSEEMTDERVLGLMLATVEHRDKKKNLSLYVSFEDGQFVAPASVVTPRSAERTIELAELALGEMGLCIKSFAETTKLSAEEVRDRFRHAEEIMKMDASASFPYLRAMQETLQEFIAKKLEAQSADPTSPTSSPRQCTTVSRGRSSRSRFCSAKLTGRTRWRYFGWPKSIS